MNESAQVQNTPPVSNEPATTPSAQQATAAQGDSPAWLDWIKDDIIKESPVIKNLQAHKEPEKAFGELAKMYVNVQPLIGRGGLKPDSTDEQVLQFRSQFSPTSRDEYKPVKNLNGSSLPEPVNDLLLDIAENRKLSQSDFEYAQKLVMENLENAPRVMQEALADKFGATNVPQIIKSSDQVIQMLPEEIKEGFVQSAGNNPYVRQAFAYLAQYFGESAYSETGNATATPPPSPTTQPQVSQKDLEALNQGYIDALKGASGNHYDPKVQEAIGKLNKAMNQMGLLHQM